MKVVCINNKELGGNGPKEQLIVGQIYEIKEYEDDSSMCYIIGFGDKGNKDNGFLKKRFITSICLLMAHGKLLIQMMVMVRL